MSGPGPSDLVSALAPADFEFVRDLVAQKSGICLGEGKEYLVKTRLLALVQRDKHPSIGDLVQRLRAQPYGKLMWDVIEALVTTETMWFRDYHPFETLKKHVLPALIAARKPERTLRIWCAACSTGQEPYSIAMTLREHFPALAGWCVSILATDISGEMLARAREGRFNMIEVNRGLPAPLLERYFEKVGLAWRIRSDLRAMLSFRQVNLIEPLPELHPMDVVFLRNVLIYFSVEQKKEIFERLRRVMRPDGYLFLGGSETILALSDRYRRERVGDTDCYRLARP